MFSFVKISTAALVISLAFLTPVSAQEEGIDPYTESCFWKLITEPMTGQILKNPDDIVPKVHIGGEGEGPIVGGCLSLFDNLMGTPYFPNVSGGILILEDIGENVQHIDRMLSQFKMAGFFHGENRINGLLLGQFIDAWEKADEDDFSLDELIQDIIGEVSFPVISNVAYGHGMRKMSFPLGAEASLDGDSVTLTLK